MKNICHFKEGTTEKYPNNIVVLPGDFSHLPILRSGSVRNDTLFQILKYLLFIFVFSFCLSTPLSAQSGGKFKWSGYLEYLNNTWIPQGQMYTTIGLDSWQNQTSIYNRFDLWWKPVNNLEFNAGIRNIFNYGPLIANYNQFFDYANLATYSNSFIDMTFDIANGNSYLLYTDIDRLNVKYTLKKFEATIGRQRINWSKNLIWNPNDIFNAYNYFDFNYVERPGSDAVLLEYYTGDFSSVQLAGKLSYKQVPKNDSLAFSYKKELQLTAAAMYRFSKWNYDFQVFGGVMQTDVTAGLGWAGQIEGAGFTGEVSWFRNQDNFTDTTGVVVASIAANYTFKNSLFIQFSGIYNSVGATGPANASFESQISSFAFVYSRNLNAKNLTPSRFDIFGQISYPATPLFTVDLASIYNTYDKSVFVGPSLTYSLTDNISLMGIGQLFWGNSFTEFGDIGQMFFLDLKWSF